MIGRMFVVLARTGSIRSAHPGLLIRFRNATSKLP